MRFFHKQFSQRKAPEAHFLRMARLKGYDVLSESPLHLFLRLIFRQTCTNLINVRSTYAS